MFDNCPVHEKINQYKKGVATMDKNGLHLQASDTCEAFEIDETGYTQTKLFNVGANFTCAKVDGVNKFSAGVHYQLLNVEKAIKIENGPGVYGSVGLDLGTGVSYGGDGVKTKILGFGINYGPGGKFGINTPLFSFGFCSKFLIFQI